jgi:hypothetical protein
MIPEITRGQRSNFLWGLSRVVVDTENGRAAPGQCNQKVGPSCELGIRSISEIAFRESKQSKEFPDSEKRSEGVSGRS